MGRLPGWGKWLLGLAVGFCCLCGVGLALFGSWFGQTAQEAAWLGAAGEAAKTATQPRADELLVIRRIQGGEPINAQNLSEFEAVCRTMAQRTQTAWADLDRLPTPTRFGDLKTKVKSGAEEIQSRWTRLADGIARRDLNDVRRNLAETEAFGDRFREDIEAELKRLYPRS